MDSSRDNVNILKYKDYEGTAEVDTARMVCRGRILFIDDVITYEAASPTKLQKEFEAAVDDYLETCEELKRAPKRPLKGQFNVRVPPELHKAAALRAVADGVSLNEVVIQALQSHLGARDVNPVRRQRREQSPAEPKPRQRATTSLRLR